VTASTTQTIPAGAPPIKLQVVVTGKDVNGSDLTCLETEIEFTSASRLAAAELEARPAIDSALLASIAMAPEGRTWTAHWSPKFANATLKQAAGMMGTVLRGHPLHLSLPEKPMEAFRTGPNDSIPASFDARDAWPQCREVIGHIRDQSACGSCWAVASTASFNDRACIANNMTELLSPTDTMACCTGAACGFSQVSACALPLSFSFSFSLSLVSEASIRILTFHTSVPPV
jgi:C1A family cysteine protease